MLAALPVQGIAAATMISCGPSHKASSAGAMSKLGDKHAAHNIESQVTSSHHAYLDAGHEAHFHESDDADSGHQHSTSSCSACGVCCVGAALIPATLDWDVRHDGSEPVLIVPQFAFLSHISAGLERPPRIFFA